MSLAGQRSAERMPPTLAALRRPPAAADDSGSVARLAAEPFRRSGTQGTKGCDAQMRPPRGKGSVETLLLLPSYSWYTLQLVDIDRSRMGGAADGGRPLVAPPQRATLALDFNLLLLCQTL